MIGRRILLPALLLLLASLAHAQPKPAPAPAPGASQNPSFNLVNKTTTGIKELFVTPAGMTTWGQNRLDGKNGNATAIAPGATYAVRRRIDNNCIFDIRVVFTDGKNEDRRGVNTCAIEDLTIGTVATTAAPATGKTADDPSFRLFNRAATPILEFYAAPAGLNNWGQNRLGTDRLPPDSTRMIAIAKEGNCIFDLRVVFADKKEREKKRVNLCKVAEIPVP
jgi:hypothetical protein